MLRSPRLFLYMRSVHSTASRLTCVNIGVFFLAFVGGSEVPQPIWFTLPSRALSVLEGGFAFICSVLTKLDSNPPFPKLCVMSLDIITLAITLHECFVEYRSQTFQCDRFFVAGEQ